MAEVVVLGDVNVDIVARLESYPPHGGDAQPLDTQLQLGGSSLNTAIMLKRLGIDVALIARVGCDVLGDFAVTEIARNGLSTEFIQRDETTTTGTVYVAITPDGERTLLGGAGANRNLAASAIPFELIKVARWLHVTSYSVLGAASLEATMQAVRARHASVSSASLDIGHAPMRLAPDAVAQLARKMAVLMPSDDVAIARESWQWILRKQGAHGCVVEDTDGRTEHVPPFSVNVVDSTGAGDAFNAGFIAGQMRGLSEPESALLANACGAAACTVRGAGGALPKREVVMQLLHDAYPCGCELEASRILIAFHSKI